MKKEILNFGKMVAIAIAVITTSCSKEISEIGKSETIIEEMYFSNINDNDELVLGRKLDNPYALENMQKAMDIIAKSSKRGVLPDRISPQKKLKPTHRYVVFLPKTKLHLEILTDLVSSKKMVSSIYPFDYEIIKYGKNYTDIRTKDKDYPVLYASVPVSEKIPNVPYEKLQDLYLTTENDDKLLETSALFLAKAIPVTADNQVARPNPITSYEKELEKYLEDEKAFANIFDFLDRSYHPQGIVRVQNSNGEYVPLRNAEIKLRSWFTNDYCTTDSNGRFYCESPCKTDKNVFITWDYNS